MHSKPLTQEYYQVIHGRHAKITLTVTRKFCHVCDTWQKQGLTHLKSTKKHFIEQTLLFLNSRVKIFFYTDCKI